MDTCFYSVNAGKDLGLPTPTKSIKVVYSKSLPLSKSLSSLTLQGSPSHSEHTWSVLSMPGLDLNPRLPFPSCVTIGKLLNFLFLWFLIYKISIIIPPAEGMMRIQYDHLCKVAQVRPHYYYL